MRIPRSRLEAKQMADLVEKNTEADDWVGDSDLFPTLSVPKEEVATDLLKTVGHTKIKSINNEE